MKNNPFIVSVKRHCFLLAKTCHVNATKSYLHFASDNQISYLSSSFVFVGWYVCLMYLKFLKNRIILVSDIERNLESCVFTTIFQIVKKLNLVKNVSYIPLLHLLH